MRSVIAAADTTTLVACDPRDPHGPQGLHGFATMTFGDEEAHLVLLAVLPASQRQGVGTRLLDWLFASARVAGTPRIRLELRADNLAAFAFYRRIGFAETGRLPGYYSGRIDARQMALTLA
jgi:ribosomal-protein-alanine N-acetyltransferase